MSGLINSIDEDQSPSVLIIKDHFQPITVYLLWSSNNDAELRIEAIFGKIIRYDFQAIDEFAHEHRSKTVLYRWEYDMQVSDEKNYTSDKYQLRLTTKSTNSPAYDDPKLRSVDINKSYQFLFDVEFPNQTSPTSKRRSDEFWNQLCFYTYFLIKNNMYEKFPYIIQQFNAELQIDQTQQLSKHLLNLKKDPNAMKIFLQMFGLLPIEKDAFDVENASLGSLAPEIYDYTKIHLNHFLRTMHRDDWQLFRQGLTVFMSARLLGNQATFNTFALLEQMKDHPEQQELMANVLLKRLVDLRKTIKDDNWTKLFALTTDKNLLINCLDLVISLDNYLLVLQHVIKHNTINEPMKLQLINKLDRLVSRTDFILSLENIIRILTCLQPEYRTMTYSSTEEIDLFQRIIKSSRSLCQKINSSVENLDINKTTLEFLRQVFQLDHSVSILIINKTNYLIRTLANFQNRTGYFYITWFTYFLCDENYQNNVNDQQNFHRLLITWVDYVKNDRDILSQVIAKLDKLFENLQNLTNNDNRLEQFTENMLIACFQPGLIFPILIDICTKITNTTFLQLYETKFIKDLIHNNKNKLKQMSDPENPLCQLLEIRKKDMSTNNQLLSNLIAECTKSIRLSDEEIRSETLIHPSRKACTYTILFEKHLNNNNLLRKTLHQLDALWSHWIQTGLTASDLDKWRKHSSEERIIFDEIWEKVRADLRKDQSVDSIFHTVELEYSEKMTLNQAMLMALNFYCDQASDYSRVKNSLQGISEQLEEKPIRKVEIPEDFKAIERIVVKLKPFVESKVWQSYYHRNLSKIDKRELQSSSSSKRLINTTSWDRDSGDDEWLSRGSSPVSLTFHVRMDNPRQARLGKDSFPPKLSKEIRTSVEILTDVDKIFEDFRTELIHICDDWRTEPIEEWIGLFTETQNIPFELEILTTKLNLCITKELINILQLWEKRTAIYHICQGCLNLTTRLHFPIEEHDLNVLKILTNFSEHFPGEICSETYEAYLNRYVSHHLSSTLDIWSQYSIAIELIDFITLVSSSDLDCLLENVNDGDDQSVGAKTVRDFQTLKHYFDQVYKSIEQLQREKRPFLLSKLLDCFDHIDLSRQIGNINDFFTSCSTELHNMKQSHSELIDKEQSKRRLIMHIMHHSSIRFTHSDKFDVDLLPMNKNFSDLMELRDRARLLEFSYSNKSTTNDQHSMEQFEQFVQFVNIVETILNTLNSLYIAGHPIISEILRIPKEFLCHENQFDQLIGFCEKLQEISLAWEQTLCEKYILYPELTYFSCRQFDMIEQFIYNRNQCNEEEYGYHLLKYIGVEPTLIGGLNQSDRRKFSADERLEDFGRMLSAQRRSSEQNRMNTKIYLIETDDQNVLKAILSLFKQFHTSPNVKHLFYCTNETTWMEIRGFLYRCIYSQRFHQLIRPELLPILIQDQIVHLLRQQIEQNPLQFFSFGIITAQPTASSQFIDGLKSLQIIQTIPKEGLMTDEVFCDEVRQSIKRYTLVTSRINGLGKTRLIREKCAGLNKIIKFPVNGNVQADVLAKRLLKEAREFENGAIHLDIGVIDNYNQINDLINCLVLFRSFCFGQIAVTIPDTTPIYIELDSSSSSNLLEHITVLKHIKPISINFIDWQKLQIDERVMFVANYLKAMKDKSIMKKDITSANLEPLRADECVRLIREVFFNGQHMEYITWTKVLIYLSVFYRLFLGFSECSYFMTAHLPRSEFRQTRMDILQAFLKSASHFTSISVETVRRQQRAANNSHSRNDPPQTQTLSDAIIRWDTIQPFTLILSPTNDPIFVYKTEQDIPPSLKHYLDLHDQTFDSQRAVRRRFFAPEPGKRFFPDYKQLTHEELFQRLAKLGGNKYLNKAICRRCFRQHGYDVLTCESCTDLPDLLERTMSLDEKDIDAFQKRIAKYIEAEYVITADNFIKMLLVFLRVQSGVPVLIMGETGCGKTALIKCLCQKILNDEIHVFRLHAGVTNEKLLEEMNNLIPKAEQLPPEKRLWVFFDEFNTMFNISLLKEIVCERTLLGKNLPENMVFLGTCNPRRQEVDEGIFEQNVGIERERFETLKLKQSRRKLLYTVTQIPETMLGYIWDYGHLDQDIEKTYIEATLKVCKGLDENRELFQIVIDLISESHKFLRELEGISSVSLRDVARFCSLYKWFTKYLSNYIDQSELAEDSSRLALFLCYYFRLGSKRKKERYLERLARYLCSTHGRSTTAYIESFQCLLEREETRLINQLKIPDDMVSNRALKDNLFVLFSCIINHIPVFLCGKPGASKTSAMQILMNNLKGPLSDNTNFRTLPQLVAVTFQGSQNCTSKSIEQVFEKAEKFMKIESNSSLLPVIIFDEIGLAEKSVHNPLKVLHGHLEIEECRFGFVGISNWRLDAAKMNRALYIACPDPDISDLQQTGACLARMNSNPDSEDRFDSNIILGLTEVYSDLIKRMSKEHRYENYFGLRDYYCLIKGIVHDCQKYPKRSRFEIIYQHLVINFGGISNGYECMWDLFCSLIDRSDLRRQFETPSPKDLIYKCLTDRNSRHLMLIVDRESKIDHVERYITTSPASNGFVKTLVGSQFEGDISSSGTYTDSYSTRVLMEIILHAETPITLVMRRMNHLYDSLYDLFNQNFAISGRKKYCRIALSSIYNPRCFIHDQFYCVILLNEKDVDRSDPPFLNRFQKHFVHIDKLMQPRQWRLRCQLLDWLLTLSLPKINKQYFSLKNLVTSYSGDYICDLVIDTCEDNDSTDEMILQSCKAKLFRACAFDFPFVLSLGGNEDLIEQYYNIHYDLLNISQLISSTFEQALATKRIIYTYTPIYDTIDYANTDQIREVKLSSIKTELELINLLKAHSQTKTPSSILIIRIDYYRENKYILSLKYNIINQWKELKDFHLWIIFHVERNTLHQTTNDVLFHGWDIVMIDDLNNRKKFISKEILVNPSYRFFLSHYQYKFLDDFFDEFIHRTLTKFRYEILSGEEQFQRYTRLINSLKNEEDHDLRRIFHHTIEHFINTIFNPDKERFKDWRQDLISNQYISLKSRSFNEALQSIMSLFYDSYFQLLIHHFERFNLIDSYFYSKEHPSTDLRNLWNECYQSSLNIIDNSMMNVNVVEIHLINDLKLPYSTRENQNLQRIREIVHTTLTEEEKRMQLPVIKLLKENSSYGENAIESILNNDELLDLYYHDQLILFHTKNQFQLSIEFTLKLLTTNTRQDTRNRLMQLIAHSEELAEILRTFEDAFKLYDENTFLANMDQQLIPSNSSDQVSKPFYSTVFLNDQFHLIPPNTLQIDDVFVFDPLADPFIEICLLNLIESLISPAAINQFGDIEHSTATFSSINQRVGRLSSYQVTNLEKLSSFMSLLRCIKTLHPTGALDIFQKSCRDYGFNATFETCGDIHQFIENLETCIVQQGGCEFDRASIRAILLKFEIEFLKNWLTDHQYQYLDIFRLINQTDNNLWKYSAKIFSHMIGELDLLDGIENSYELSVTRMERVAELDRCLQSFEQSEHILHRLFVNRIHLDLTLSSPTDNQSIKTYLTEYYKNFEKSIQSVTTSYLTASSSKSTQIQLILLLSWLKYYAQLYSLALVNNLRFQYWMDIDRYLTNNRSPFCLTVKVFILKQILNIAKTDWCTFQTNSKCRDLSWLQEFFEKFNEERHTTERSFILPIPLLEAKEQYTEVNQILSDYTNDNEIERLISRCSTNQNLSYCFYLWFIKYYTQYANENFQPNDAYRHFFQRKLSDQSKIFLQPIGIQFLQMLCTNFSPDSFFHLDTSMSNRQIAIRLVVHNIFALTLSFKTSGQANWINTILFNNNFRIPTNYFEHLQSLCLFGLSDADPIKANMKHVRASVKQRLASGRVAAAGKYIYQCSRDCLYLYNFTHCGIPNQKSQCPLCRKEIGASKYGNLIERDPPQIQMNIEQGLEMIDQYIERSNRETRLGYYEAISSDQSFLEQKPDHLKIPITHRFLHLFLHSILILLKEFKYLSDENLERWNIYSESYFQDHIEKDYSLLEKCISDSDSCYIWIFQLLNHMLNSFQEPLGSLNSREKMIQLEKSIEEQLIHPHSNSKMDKVIRYKKIYAEYSEQEEEKNNLINYLNERTENDRHYPFLNFFNVTQIFSRNQIEEFSNNLKVMSHAKRDYPLTMYILEHVKVWSNIRYLYPMMQLINYLREKYNHRISRQQAVSKSIQECLDEKGGELFKAFSDVWSKINLKEVRYDCQVRAFDQQMNRDKKLAFFSLNVSKDDSSLILSATLQTIAKLQNEIVHFFHNEISQLTNVRSLPIHLIENEHLLQLDMDFINEKIIKNALVMNFQYGQSKDIIYDYGEIEMTFRSLINRLPLINIDEFRKIQYQFELYSENSALINDVRRHRKQIPIDNNLREQYRRILGKKDENDILQYLGSLDYIFTYFKNRNYRSDISTIKLFVNQYIHSKFFLHQNLFLESSFASTRLEYIMDLYELIEEIAFDKIVRNHIEEKLNDQMIDNHQRKSIQEKFLALTIENQRFATRLHDIHQWISTLKRFMVRILPDDVDLALPIEIYLKRTDLWNGQITEEDIETIQLDENILLKHTFIILLGLENRLSEMNDQKPTAPSPNLLEKTPRSNPPPPRVPQKKYRGPT